MKIRVEFTKKTEIEIPTPSHGVEKIVFQKESSLPVAAIYTNNKDDSIIFVDIPIHNMIRFQLDCKCLKILMEDATLAQPNPVTPAPERQIDVSSGEVK